MNTINVMRQAIEALEYHTAQTRPVLGTEAAITALRAELERLDAVEPVAWIDPMALDRIKSLEPGSVIMTSISGTCERPWVRPIYTAPIAPAIPALTIEDVAASAPEFADVPKYGPAYLAGAHWAYTLAAARTGARIIKADPLQELADDARQIGLEY